VTGRAQRRRTFYWVDEGDRANSSWTIGCGRTPQLELTEKNGMLLRLSSLRTLWAKLSPILQRPLKPARLCDPVKNVFFAGALSARAHRDAPARYFLQRHTDTAFRPAYIRDLNPNELA
jgi:hypothetical protein